MDKHTPGPWECMGKGQMYTGAGKYLVMAPEQDYITLAEIPAPIHSIPHSKVVAKANARLIAAAPDLLKAAQAMLSAHKDRGLTCDTVLSNAAGKIRAAIAKATT